MRYFVRFGGAAMLLAGLANVASAEALYSVTGESLQGTTLFEQLLNEPMLVTVKPSASDAFSGDVDVLKQCLWSVMVDFSVEPATYSAGKMICIGPDQEVLESIPMGTVLPFGQCADSKCSNYIISAEETVTMRLSQPLEFNLQPRNERK